MDGTLREDRPKLTLPAALPSPLAVPFECTDIWPLAKDAFERAHGRDGEGLLHVSGTDLPPAPPPYPSSWYEWKTEADMTVCVGIVSYDEVKPYTNDKYVEWRKGGIEWVTLTAGARWIQVLTPIFYVGDHPDAPKKVPFLFPDVAVVVALDTNGKFLRSRIHVRGHRVQYEEIETAVREEGGGYLDLKGEITISRLVRMAVGDCFAALFFQGLLACKNVERCDVDPPPALSKKRVRHGKQPLVRYHILKVKVPGTTRYWTPQAHVSSGEVPVGLHLVRGHFKTYIPERPLLGHSVGTYYWPPFIRGTLKAGAIGKTYAEVKGGNP